MSAGRPKLTEKQELAISALLTERTHALAATRSGVSESTITRWLQNPDFRLAYRQARRAVVEGTIAALQAAGAAAAETLQASLSCTDAAVRVRAASLILEHGFRGLEVMDLVGRVEELESLLKGNDDGESVDDPPGEVDSGSEDPPSPGEASP